MDDNLIRWKPLPVQIIRAGTNVILKRGCTEIRFRESKYADHLTLLLHSCRTGATEREILGHFEQGDQLTIQDLVSLLQAKSILVPTTGTVQEEQSPQSPLEIFYWHFEHQGRTIADRLESRQIVLLGDNILSRELDHALATSGFRDVITVEYPGGTKWENATDHQRSPGTKFSHRAKQPIPYETWLQKVNWKAIGCFVATSDFGGRALLREWNELAVRNHCHFLPIVLQNVIGYIG